MATVNMHDAKSRLSALVEAIESGRESEIILARNGRPAARIVPVAAKRPIRLGLAQGQFVVPDDIDEYENEIATAFAGDGKL